MSREVLGCDAWARDTGIKHANAVELGGTPESAIARVMERAVEKYGPQDWRTWEFRAEPIPKTSGAATVRFVWRDGGAGAGLNRRAVRLSDRRQWTGGQ